MNGGICCLALLLSALSATAQPLRVTSFHASELSLNSDLEGVADIIQQYDFAAIQDLRDLAAADQLLAILFRRGDFFKVLPSQPSAADETRYAFAWRDRRVQILAPGSFLDIGAERRPVYAAFRAGDFDFVALNYQTRAPAASAATELEQAYQDMLQRLPEEGDILLFTSLAEPTPSPAPLRNALPLDVPVALDGSGASANIYLVDALTREFTGVHGVDFFDQHSEDAQAVEGISQRRPVWAEFTTDGGDDDGPGIALPSAVEGQTWGRAKTTGSTAR